MDRRSAIRQLFLSKPSDYMRLREPEYSESSDERNVKAIANSVPTSYNRHTVWSSLGRNLGLFSRSALTPNLGTYGNLGVEAIEKDGNYQVVRIGKRTFVIGAVVAGAIAAGAVAYYFVPGFRNLVNGFIDKSPPSIKDLKWEPTRVVNGKIYDGKVSFVAEDWLSDISEAYIDFVPVYPPEIPKEAFPAEDPRSFTLRPNETPSKTASFSQAFTGLKGGKGYQIKVRAKDTAGNESTGKAYNSDNKTGNILDIPYLRQFEDLTDSDDILVGAYYMSYWGKKSWFNFNLVGVRTPLLGYYDFANPYIFAKQTDQATGHRIDFFMVSFNYADTIDDPKKFLGVINNPISNNIRIALLYETEENLPQKLLSPENIFYGDYFTDLDDKNTLDQMKAHFTYINEMYFSSERFLRIQGRPVVMLYHSGAFIGDVSHGLGMIRDLSQDYGFNPYIIGDNMFWDGHSEPNLLTLELYDAISDYDMIGGRKWFTDTILHYESSLDKEFDFWQDATRQRGVPLIPLAIPGFDTRGITDCCKEVLERDITKWPLRLQIAKKHLDSTIRTMMISSYNLWTENSQAEPSIGEGFSVLDGIKNL